MKRIEEIAREEEPDGSGWWSGQQERAAVAVAERALREFVAAVHERFAESVQFNAPHDAWEIAVSETAKEWLS